MEVEIVKGKGAKLGSGGVVKGKGACSVVEVEIVKGKWAMLGCGGRG